jgi:tripartite-type tricarboxylate transporter receptor subunit TctC
MIRRLLTGLALAASLMTGFTASAQEWPNKTIRIVVPFPPGGSADPIARAIAQKLQASLGQPVIVENKPGASGSIGTDFVAKSPADGYTFVVVFDTHAVNPFLIPKLPFDTNKDLQPITLIGIAPLVLATPPSRPFKSLADVVTAAKASPGTISFGSVQNGSTGHLQMILWQQAAGVKLIHAPYRGAGPMLTDALGGHIDLAIGSAAVMSNPIKSEKLRGIAVTSAQRSPSLPGLQTFAEAGFRNMDAYAWWGFYAPAGLPKPILDRVHAETIKALQSPDVKQTLEGQLGMQLVLNTPEEFRAFVNAEMDKWGKIVRENGIKMD